MDGGAWLATIHGVAKSQTQLSDFTSLLHFIVIKIALRNKYWLPWCFSWLRICLQCRRPRIDPWRRKQQLTPVFLPGKSHRQRSLAGYSPPGHRVRHDWATQPPLSFLQVKKLRLKENELQARVLGAIKSP